MVTATLTLRAQQVQIRPDDPAFIAKYADFNLKGKFAAVVEQDETNNYYLVDFTSFHSRFERVYFMNLTFTTVKLVNIDPNVTRSRVWFMANRKYVADEVFKLFEELKQKVKITTSSWSEADRAQWLKKNDKYN